MKDLSNDPIIAAFLFIKTFEMNLDKEFKELKEKWEKEQCNEQKTSSDGC